MMTEDKNIKNEELNTDTTSKSTVMSVITNSKTTLLNSLVNEDEDVKDPELKRLADVMQAFSINGMWFRRQLGVITLLVIGVIIYITNRYQAQQEMIEEQRLRFELQDKRYRSMTRNSELIYLSRQSLLERSLKAMGDTTLLQSKEPLYKIEK